MARAAQARGVQDSVVIGAGIVGMMAALTLQRAGRSVMVVDQGPPGEGCSYGNAGAISPDMCVPMALPGMLRRVPRWLLDPLGPLVVRWSYLPRALPWLIRWVRAGDLDRVRSASAALRALHGPSFDRYRTTLGNRAGGLIEMTGQIYVWETGRPGPTEALARELREAHGIETRALTAAEIHTMDPNLAAGFAHGLFFPENGHTVNPLRLVQTLVDLFIEAGGQVVRRRVTGFEQGPEGVRRIRLEDGDLEAGLVVVAAGIASRTLAAQLGDRVPLEAERGYHVMLPAPGIRPAIKISNREQMFGLTPMEHGVRIAGTVEIAGVDAPMDERRPRAMLAHAKRMYPGLNDEGATFWMGCRPSTPDSLPVIDRASRARNVIYAFGHGHTGLTGAPLTADLVQALAMDRPPAISPEPYRLARF